MAHTLFNSIFFKTKLIYIHLKSTLYILIEICEKVILSLRTLGHRVSDARRKGHESDHGI